MGGESLGCLVVRFGAEAQRQAPRTPNTHARNVGTQRRDAENTPTTTYTHTHLSVVVEVPQVQAAHAIHGGEESGMHGRPHDVIDIVCVVLERVQRLVVLKKKKKSISV